MSMHSTQGQTIPEPHDRQDEFFRLMYDQSPLGILSLDYEGRIMNVNSTMLELMGYECEFMLNRWLGEFLEPPEADDFRVRYPERVEESGWRRTPYRLKRKEGSPLEMELFGRVIRDEKGRFNCTHCIFYDITERQRLERELSRISENERRNLSQYLHDNLGQQLTGIKYLLEALARRLQETLPDEAREADSIKNHIHQTLEQIQDMGRNLYPLELDAEGLYSALVELAYNTEKYYDTNCNLEQYGFITFNDPFLAAHVYYIAQESVNNAARHSGAKNIRIRLFGERNMLAVKIEDDGRGITATPPRNGGMGLQIMNHRAGVIGGALSITPGERGGTVVVCSVPLNKK